MLNFTWKLSTADDDSTMKTLLKHEKNGKGKLLDQIPEPYWYSNPSHRVKCIAKPIYKLAYAPNGLSMVKAIDAICLKKHFGYFLKQSVNKEFKDMKLDAKAQRQYNSLSGHGFMIGSLTRNIIAAKLKSKACSKCIKYTLDKAPKLHKCQKK